MSLYQQLSAPTRMRRVSTGQRLRASVGHDRGVPPTGGYGASHTTAATAATNAPTLFGVPPEHHHGENSVSFKRNHHCLRRRCLRRRCRVRRLGRRDLVHIQVGHELRRSARRQSRRHHRHRHLRRPEPRPGRTANPGRDPDRARQRNNPRRGHPDVRRVHVKANGTTAPPDPSELEFNISGIGTLTAAQLANQSFALGTIDVGGTVPVSVTVDLKAGTGNEWNGTDAFLYSASITAGT
jgi:hypothetical protein